MVFVFSLYHSENVLQSGWFQDARDGQRLCFRLGRIHHRQNGVSLAKPVEKGIVKGHKYICSSVIFTRKKYKCQYIHTLRSKDQSLLQPSSVPQMIRLLVGVEALDRVLRLLRTGNEAKAVLVASGVGDAVEPDRVLGTKSRTASLEANVLTSLVTEDEVHVVVDGEALALTVLNERLNASGVLDEALAHAGPVHEHLLGWVRSVEVQRAVVELELGVLVGLGAAGGVLSRGADDEAAVGGLQRCVLEVGA